MNNLENEAEGTGNPLQNDLLAATGTVGRFAHGKGWAECNRAGLQKQRSKLPDGYPIIMPMATSNS